MLSDWVEKGYVDGDVWKDLAELLSPETIESALNERDSSVNRSKSDAFVSRVKQIDRILSHVSQYVYPSELKEFAVKRLGLRETQYEMIEEDHIYAKRRNFEVNVDTNYKICINLFFKSDFLKLYSKQIILQTMNIYCDYFWIK